MVENESLMTAGKEIVITGANGYLGQHLSAALMDKGAALRAFVRPSIGPEDITVLKGLGATIFTGELGPGAQLPQAFAGADCAVHLIGSVAPPKDGPGSEELHKAYSLYFAEACVKAGVKKAVLVTALGAHEKSVSQYLVTKRKAEIAFLECLRQAKISCVVVRPSLIIGHKIGHRDSKLVDRYRTIINTKKVIPLIGGGQNLLEPVFVGDLAQAIANLIMEDNRNSSEIVEIGGPQRVTMRAFVEALARSLAISKPVLSLPFGLASLAAGVLGQLQDVSLLSADQVKLASEDMIPSVNALPSLLAPAQALSIEQALATYQGRVS